MVKRWINNAILVVIILCSTSFYRFSFLGPMQKGAELMGPVIIFVLIFFHLVYSNQKSIRQNFSTAILLIMLSLLSSMVTAYVVRDQRIIHTLLAQTPLYYYFLYFLLHQLRFDLKDVEKIIVFFAFVYIGLHFLQTILYPKIIFNSRVFAERGTIRVYLPGAHYISVGFYLYLQRFLRSNKMKYILFLLLIFSVFVMRAGRQPLAILLLTTVLFVMIDRKVKSRFFLIILGMIGAFSMFLIFQNIFIELLHTSQRDMTLGEEYIRINSARSYLTDFFEAPIAYVTGNGMYYEHSNYGELFDRNHLIYHYHIGDIGLIGNYVIYGLFFIIAVIIICTKALKIKIESAYIYVKYFVFASIISLIVGGGFANSDFICLMVLLLYMIDASNQSYIQHNQSDIKDEKVSIMKYAESQS